MRLQKQEGVSEVVGILILLFAFLFMCLLIWFLYHSSEKPLVVKEALSATNVMMILITMIILVAIIFLGFKYFAKKKKKIRQIFVLVKRKLYTMINLKPNWRNLTYLISFILIAFFYPIVPYLDLSNCEELCQGIECLSCQNLELKFVNLNYSLSSLNLFNLIIILIEFIIFYFISCFFISLYTPNHRF